MSNSRKYKLVRPAIMDGDIIATAGKGLFSRIIRWFTRSKYSHVGLLFNDHGRIFIIEATAGKGVRKILASKVLKNTNFDVFRYHTVPDNLYGNLLSRLGDGYDYLGMFLSLFIDTKSSICFCSELVGVEMKMDFPANDNKGITPLDVVNKCRKVTHD